MIRYARPNPEEHSDTASSHAGDYIAPAPRVSVQAFCATEETAAAVRSAGEDRRLAKAHLSDEVADIRLGRPRPNHHETHAWQLLADAPGNSDELVGPFF